MYDFVKTATGWRVFWGIDPYTYGQSENQENFQESTEENMVLPFRRRETENEELTAA